MKTDATSMEKFTDLTQAELTGIGGEGFAYDAGRFLRAMVQCGCGGPGGYASMVADMVVIDFFGS